MSYHYLYETFIGREDSNVSKELAGEKMGRIVEKELFDLIHQEKNIIAP